VDARDYTAKSPVVMAPIVRLQEFPGESTADFFPLERWHRGLKNLWFAIQQAVWCAIYCAIYPIRVPT
jgi:hypothetical protein